MELILEMNRRALLKTSALIAGSAFAGRVVGQKGGMPPASPEVNISTGRIRGSVNRGVFVFKGIPYGADTAPRRFMSPIPPTPWGGIRETNIFGPRAPQ